MGNTWLMNTPLKILLHRILFLVVMAFVSASVYANEIGKSLYKQYCTTCHGANGQGGVGVPLALKSFQAQASDRFLKNTIRYGRKGRVMPAFTKMNEAELDALVKYIRGFSNVTPPVYDQTPIKGNTIKGGKLFAEHCASCHGADGKGGKGTGVTLSRPREMPIIAPALNNEGFLKSASDAMIKRTLIQGREGTPMLPFDKNGLKEQDINDIVAYIRSYTERLQPEKTSDEPYYLEAESSVGMQETIESLKAAIVGKNYRLIRVQNLDNGLVDEKNEDKKKVIVYFCNFKLLYEALAIDPRIGLFLPCRITVVEQNGKVKLMAINPTHLSNLFNNDELNNLCKVMRKTYETILEEATL